MDTFIETDSTTDCRPGSTVWMIPSLVMVKVHNLDTQLTGTFLTSQVEKNFIGNGLPSLDSVSVSILSSSITTAINHHTFDVLCPFWATPSCKGGADLAVMSVTGEERSTGSARMKRFSSARQRPQTSLVRPFTASRPRRPYSAYTHRGSEETGPKYDAPETAREWWRHYVKVRFYTHWH